MLTSHWCSFVSNQTIFLCMPSRPCMWFDLYTYQALLAYSSMDVPGLCIPFPWCGSGRRRGCDGADCGYTGPLRMIWLRWGPQLTQSQCQARDGGLHALVRRPRWCRDTLRMCLLLWNIKDVALDGTLVNFPCISPPTKLAEVLLYHVLRMTL